MKTYCAALSIFAVALAVGPRADAANILGDGSFETPNVSGSPGYQTFLSGDTALSPWVIGLNSIDVLNVSNSIVVGPAYDGSQYVDLNGNDTGQLSQTFATSALQQYQFSFAYADNYSGPPSPHKAEVQIFDTNTNADLIVPLTITHNTSVPNNLNWIFLTGTFTAIDSTTTIRFTSIDTAAEVHAPTAPSGILLDDVTVEAIPETSTIVAALLTLALLAGHAVRRRLA